MRGEHVLPVRVREIDQDFPQGVRAVDERENHLALLHAVHRHVDVVAGARGVQAAGRFLAARLPYQPVDEEEQIFAGAVVADVAHVVQQDAVERGPDRVRVARRDDRPLREHHQVRIMNAHQRREEVRLGVLEVLVEDAGDVFGGKGHADGYVFPGLRRFAISLYAPSVPAGSWRHRPRPR